MRKTIVGPLMADLDAVGLDGEEVVVASAFYSRQRLDQLMIGASRVDLLLRLNTSSLEEWIGGAIAPDALLDFMARQAVRSSRVRLFVSPTAHAKVYLGSAGFLVGSANLTVRGLGGLGDEILWHEDDPEAGRAMGTALRRYRRNLRLMSTGELNAFVARHREFVRAARAKLTRRRAKMALAEDMLPAGVPSRATRLGDFDGFARWLSNQRGDAPQLIARRAGGEGQLSGHIRRNFFGLRQFFIAYPEEMHKSLRRDPETYTLRNDVATQTRLRDFVLHEAVDEDDLSVSTWRTYLPESAGGKPKSGGGTSGNLKRMLPLVARYLRRRIAWP